jgi:hypothetical protein
VDRRSVSSKLVLGRVGRPGQVEHRHFCSGLGERTDVLAAEPAGTAGDDRDLSGQIEQAFEQLLTARRQAFALSLTTGSRRSRDSIARSADAAEDDDADKRGRPGSRRAAFMN